MLSKQTSLLLSVKFSHSCKMALGIKNLRKLFGHRQHLNQTIKWPKHEEIMFNNLNLKQFSMFFFIHSVCGAATLKMMRQWFACCIEIGRRFVRSPQCLFSFKPNIFHRRNPSSLPNSNRTSYELPSSFISKHEHSLHGGDNRNRIVCETS